MLLTEFATVKWAKRNKDYYVDKGYYFTDYGDEFQINIHDLPAGTKFTVEFECDECHTKHEIQWRTYGQKVNKGLCLSCAKKKIKSIWNNMDEKIDDFRQKRRVAYLRGDIY